MGDVFKALADPTRRIILDELTSRAGPAREQSQPGPIGGGPDLADAPEDR